MLCYLLKVVNSKIFKYLNIIIIMEMLERLSQDEFGKLYRSDKQNIPLNDIIPVGKIKTIVEANPCIDISDVINKMSEQNSLFIPYGANSYVASDFNPDTQHLRKSNLEGDQKLYSVFAIQFYYLRMFHFC